MARWTGFGKAQPGGHERIAPAGFDYPLAPAFWATSQITFVKQPDTGDMIMSELQPANSGTMDYLGQSGFDVTGNDARNSDMPPISYTRHRFPADVIPQTVRLCFRFMLSCLDIEDLTAERGIDVSYETIRCWTPIFGQLLAGNFGITRPGAQAAGISMRRW